MAATKTSSKSKPGRTFVRALKLRGKCATNGDADIEIGTECDLVSPVDDAVLHSCTWHDAYSVMSLRWGTSTWQTLRFDAPSSSPTSHEWHREWCANAQSELYARNFRDRLLYVAPIGHADKLALVATANAADEHALRLSVWDVLCGVVVAKCQLKTDGVLSAIAPAPEHFDSCVVAYATGKRVSVCPLRVGASNLANILGRMKASESFLKINTAAAADTIEDETAIETDLKALAKIATAAPTKRATQLCKLTNNHIDGAKRTGRAPSQRFVQRALALALGNEDAPMWNAVDALLSTKCVSASTHADLIALLLRHERLRLLRIALNNVSDITEHDMVLVLCFLLRKVSKERLAAFYVDVVESKKQSNGAKKTRKRKNSGTPKASPSKKRGRTRSSSAHGLDASANGTSEDSELSDDAKAYRAVSRFVKQIASSTYDREFMCAALRRLGLSEVVLLLQMAHAWISNERRVSPKVTTNCCRLVEVLIDAHFMQLRLAVVDRPDLAVVLSELNELFRESIAAARTLSPLGGQISQLKKMNGTEKPKGGYTIERLVI